MHCTEITITYPKVLEVLHETMRTLIEDAEVIVPKIEKKYDRNGIPIYNNENLITITIPKEEQSIRLLKDWFDLNWNNETGAMIYRKNYIGDMQIEKYMKDGVNAGVIVEKIMCYSVYPIDWEEIDNKVKITFHVDYYHFL